MHMTLHSNAAVALGQLVVGIMPDIVLGNWGGVGGPEKRLPSYIMCFAGGVRALMDMESVPAVSPPLGIYPEDC